MPKCLPLINKFLKAVDLFPTTNLLRYNSEPEYTSATGGTISTLIIVIFIILFANMGLRTINREIITSTTSTQYSVNPEPITFSCHPDNKGLLFLLNPWGYSLTTATNRPFNVTMYHEFYRFSQFHNSTQVPMVPCTKQHLNFTPQLLRNYDYLNLSQALCPPLNYEFTVTGQSTSQYWGMIRINIWRCNNTIDATCMSDSDFITFQNNLKQFLVTFSYVHQYVNPGQENYKGYFYDDSDFSAFSSQIGAGTYSYIHMDKVQTDVSLMPNPEIVTDKIIRAPDNAKNINWMLAPGQPFAQFYIMRSGETVTYSREFNKLDNYFSYVGGLIGTIIGIIFILGKYNQKAYQISVAHKIFKDRDNNPISSRGFNLIYFILMPIKSFFNIFNCNIDWNKTQTFLEASQEISHQLDVTYIMRKLNFVDAALSKLMEKHELQTIYIRDKPSIDEIKKQRILHFALELLQQQPDPDEKQSSGQHGNNKIKNNSFQCSTSKQHIMEQSIDPSIQKQEEKEFQFEDLSALELSRRLQDINQLQKSVTQVYKQSKMGKKISKKIIKEVNPKFLQKIPRQEQQMNKNEAKMIIVRSNQFCEDSQSREEKNQNEVKQHSDFDYIFPREQ